MQGNVERANNDYDLKNQLHMTRQEELAKISALVLSQTKEAEKVAKSPKNQQSSHIASYEDFGEVEVRQEADSRNHSIA